MRPHTSFGELGHGETAVDVRRRFPTWCDFDDPPLRDVVMNLQYDNQLAHRVVKTGVPAFRVWQSRRGLAKSNAGLRQPRAVRAIDRRGAAGRPVGIRPTADQVVSQGKGIINLLLLPETRSGIIDGMFQCLIVRVPQILNRLGIETYWGNIPGSIRHGLYRRKTAGNFAVERFQ